MEMQSFGLLISEEGKPMCDYSLHDVESRQAAKGDELMLGKFGQYNVTAFGRPEDGTVCVTCVPHGTKLLVSSLDGKPREAIFGHNDQGQWQDGLIFSDTPNVVLSLQDLALGTTAKVVTLPLVKAPPVLSVAGVVAQVAAVFGPTRQVEHTAQY